MSVELYAAAAVIGSFLMGFAWRVRGGFWPTGSTFIARMISSVTFAALVVVLSGFSQVVMIASPILIAAMYVGTAKGWAEWQDMGTWPTGDDRANDFRWMTLRGLYLTVFPGAVLGLLGYIPVLFPFGLLLGSIYLGCWIAYEKHGMFSNGGSFIDGPAAAAEILVGVIIVGIGSTITMLLPQDYFTYETIISLVK